MLRNTDKWDCFAFKKTGARRLPFLDLTNLKDVTQKLKAVVLAAGEGSRLRPLTFTQPKPMIPLGKEPVIHHIMSKLKLEGFDEIVMVVGPMKEQIMGYVGNGSRFGQQVSYGVKPDEFLSGTAGSLKLVDYLLYDDTFLIAQSDTLTEIPLMEAVKFHKRTKAHATVVLTKVEDPTGFGVAVVDSTGAITEFQEKPRLGEAKSNLVSTGFYILEPEVLDYIETETFDFALDLFPRLLKLHKRISGFASEAFWVDIGTLEGYLKGTKWVLDKMEEKDRVSISQDAQIGTGVSISGPSLIEAGTVIADNAKILPYSVIKKDARISSGAIIDRSIIFERTSIGRECTVVESAIAQAATLHTQVSSSRSIIGPGSVIGDRAKLLEGSRIWPNVVIPDDQTVNNIVFVRFEESFRFYSSLGQYTGYMASTADGFIDTLGKVPIKSIEFHAKRRDFEKWVREVLKSDELADEIESLRRRALIGEELRTELIEVTKKWAHGVSHTSNSTSDMREAQIRNS